MGMIVDFMENALKEFKTDFLRELSGRLNAACESSTREIREEITDYWFRGYNGSKTKAATVYFPNTTISGDHATCIVDTYTDSALYVTPPRAAAYLARHPDYPVTHEPSDWVLHLFHDTGDIGLPPGSTVTTWVNPTPHRYNTLTNELAINGLWGLFEGLVMSKL